MYQRMPAPETRRRINHVTRILGIRNTVQDSRPPQTAAPVVVPSADQIQKAARTFGIDSALYHAKRSDVLVHDCYNARRGDKKSHRCDCHNRIAYATARNLIGRGLADFVKFKRNGLELENRKSIVLTEEFKAQHARSQDACWHKAPLSISDFLEYHMASICSEITEGLDPAIQKVRLAIIQERKNEVLANRTRRVHARGTGPDSDASSEDMVNSDMAVPSCSTPAPLDSHAAVQESLDRADAAKIGEPYKSLYSKTVVAEKTELEEVE